MATFPSPSVASPHPISTLRRFCFLKMRSALALRAARRNGAEMRFKVGSGTITKLVILKKKTMCKTSQKTMKYWKLNKTSQNVPTKGQQIILHLRWTPHQVGSTGKNQHCVLLKIISNSFSKLYKEKTKKQHISIAYNSPVNFWPWGYSTGDRKWMMWMIINDMHPLFYDFR